MQHKQQMWDILLACQLMCQDLFTEKVKEIDREEDDLYYLIMSKIRVTKDQIVGCGFHSQNDHGITYADIRLWHKRMGHVPTVLHKMFASKLFSISYLVNNFTVCPCARQIRQPFSINTTASSKPFELVHKNVPIRLQLLMVTNHS